MIVLKKDDKPGSDQKSISHDIEDTKTKIPHFIVPESLPKRVKKNDRNLQFTQSVKRIFDELGEKYEDEEENIEEPVEEDEEEIFTKTDLHTTETDFENKTNEDPVLNIEKNSIDDLKKSKVASLLKQAQEISKKELE